MEQEVNGILVAAHELKAPLSVLRQLALSMDFDDDKTTLNHFKSEMISVSERALKQVNDLTKISRLEDGLFQMEPVSIRAVCDDVTKELSYLFRYNERELFVKYTNKSKLVTANRELLHSVIYNFLLVISVFFHDKHTRGVCFKMSRDIKDFCRGVAIDLASVD